MLILLATGASFSDKEERVRWSTSSSSGSVTETQSLARQQFVWGSAHSGQGTPSLRKQPNDAVIQALFGFSFTLNIILRRRQQQE